MTPAPSVLVTGAAKRLGARIARRFGEAGWHVVVHYRNSRDDAEALAAALPDARTIQADLSSPDECLALTRSLSAELPDWRAVVSSASVFEDDGDAGLDPDTFDSAMAANTRGPAILALAYLRTATAARGRHFIQITDQKTANPNPDFLSYSLSKFAVAGLAPMLSKLPLCPGDRVYSLAPGAILASHDQQDAETEVSHRLNLLRRKTGADEIAEAALFLASGALASGQTVYVDSGQWLLDQPRDVIYLARDATASR